MQLRDKHGSPFRLWIMQKPFIVISAPEDFEVYLILNFHIFNLNKINRWYFNH